MISMDSHKFRANLLLFFFIGMFLLLIFKLFYLQIIKHSFYIQLSADQRLRAVELLPDRGDILDRNGNVLATSVDKWSIYVRPKAISNKDEVLSKLIKIDKKDEGLIRSKFSSNTNFWLRRKAEKDFAGKIAAIGSTGIDITSEKKRIYPKGRLAAQLIGFSGLDNKGLSGIEQEFDSYLLGKPGKYVFERDPSGREITSGTSKQVQKSTEGMNIYLTIDESIQYVAQRELEKYMKECKAINGSITVVDIKTGDILAVAGYPDFDPNEYSKYPMENWKLSPFTNIYEPGSTFKVIAASAGLEEGVVDLDSPIPVPDSIRIGGITVRNSHALKMFGKAYKTLRDVIAESLNTGTAYIGIKLGPERYYKYIKNFGFGEYSGIEFPGEQRGMLRRPADWSKSDSATYTFGQTIAVTPVQLVYAVAAIANEGVRIKPRLIRKIESIDEDIVRSVSPAQLGRAISVSTSKKVKELMKGVATMTHGTGHKAVMSRFSVAVKTGTAQKPAPGGGYMKDRFVASIVGFCPAKDPAIAILVVINEPKTSIWGATVAAPVFKNVGEFTLRYLNVAPDL
ncbi:MAG: penicillin-binding protein 2 [Candidatus Margulisiibacteriota bacterium]